eukprot:m.160187 g.160187  ORF g.160187 m.160187 type:complete len:891 (-) comp14346_c1_seq4:425-3097(-)
MASSSSSARQSPSGSQQGKLSPLTVSPSNSSMNPATSLRITPTVSPLRALDHDVCQKQALLGELERLAIHLRDIEGGVAPSSLTQLGDILCNILTHGFASRPMVIDAQAAQGSTGSASWNKSAWITVLELLQIKTLPPSTADADARLELKRWIADSIEAQVLILQLYTSQQSFSKSGLFLPCSIMCCSDDVDQLLKCIERILVLPELPRRTSLHTQRPSQNEFHRKRIYFAKNNIHLSAVSSPRTTYRSVEGAAPAGYFVVSPLHDQLTDSLLFDHEQSPDTHTVQDLKLSWTPNSELVLRTHKSPKPAKLPEGWDSAFDPVTGHTYFIDHKSKRTTWELPQSLTSSETNSENTASQSVVLEVTPKSPVTAVFYTSNTSFSPSDPAKLDPDNQPCHILLYSHVASDVAGDSGQRVHIFTTRQGLLLPDNPADTDSYTPALFHDHLSALVGNRTHGDGATAPLAASSTPDFDVVAFSGTRRGMQQVALALAQCASCRCFGVYAAIMGDDSTKLFDTLHEEEGLELDVGPSRQMWRRSAEHYLTQDSLHLNWEVELDPTLSSPSTSRVGASTLETFMDSEGRLIDFDGLKKLIFFRGIDSSVRHKLWPMLLGVVCPWATEKQRVSQLERRKHRYKELKSRWLATSCAEGLEVRGMIKNVVKDAARTDRNFPMFIGLGNVWLAAMVDILVTWTLAQRDRTYSQGMSDLLAPLLAVTKDEALAYWCFDSLMQMMADNFDTSGAAMQEQLELLCSLVTHLNPTVAQYIDQRDQSNMLFAYRWLLLSFKREFHVHEVIELWNVLWTRHRTNHFLLFVGAALIDNTAPALMEFDRHPGDLLQFYTSIAYTQPLSAVLSRARKLLYELQTDEGIASPSSPLAPLLNRPMAYGRPTAAT